ncbi:formyl transferase [Rhizobium sp. KVB221]|uniref:Formyl transferase n=1 Tax=Rhizobium setariae TaxID=2801340 RepID=A0A936YQY7_9HYPH|nr:formyl transferase [Rhizobium setariae]MBL0375088.1 formyl transferase [Rhizobium setariae]
MQEIPPESNVHGTILVLTAGGPIPTIMIDALAEHFPDRVRVLHEEPESKWKILRSRARRFGWVKACGQLATMIASRLGKKSAARRWADIMAEHAPLPRTVVAPPVHRVTSLNDPAARTLIRELSPAVVVTVSCRLLASSTLAEITRPVLNFHAGINPAYRGQMGGYWALVEGDSENFGATVHLVDAGIDTGGALYEKRLLPNRADSISTYPLLLTAASTDIVIRAVEDALANRLAPYSPPGRSVLRYPPTIWTWLANGFKTGIW